MQSIQHRDGQIADVLANDLVPGDVVHFGVGDRIPADCRLIAVSRLACNRNAFRINHVFQCVGLEIDESNLTGENKPRRKISEAISTSSFGELALNERENIAFMGTLVRNGMFEKKNKETSWYVNKLVQAVVRVLLLPLAKAQSLVMSLN